MPGKKNPLTPKEQRKRFEEEVRKRIAAGELNPTEADEAVERLLSGGKIVRKTQAS